MYRHLVSRALLVGLWGVLLLTVSSCKESGGVKVSSFSFKGTKAVTAGQLKSVLATGASSKIPWGQKRYFSREQFEADLKRIVAFYKDRGYPAARVTSFDAKLNTDQTSVALTVAIDEGEPVRVERVVIDGFEAVPAQHRVALEGSLPLKPGLPLDRALMQASREQALDELRDHGYPYAAVRMQESQGSSEHLRLLTLSAEPGPLTTFGPIELNRTGRASVSENVIRRQLTYRPGGIYRQGALQESQRRLYSQELFEFVNVEPIKLEGQPPEIPTRVTITEGKKQKVNFGVGYGSEEKARAEVDWRFVNFLGAARTAGVVARYSSLDRGVRLNFNQPYFFGPRYSLGLTGQSWHTEEPVFTLDTTGGRATVTREFRRGVVRRAGARPALTLSATYAREYESYSISSEALEDLSFRNRLIALGLDPRTGTGEGTRSAVSLDAGRNTTNNLLDARQGYLASLHFEQAGGVLGGTYDYYEVTGEGRTYRSFGRLVGAVQLRAGSIAARGDQDREVPFFKRYFLGGATNLRGWGRFEVAPLSGFGLPLGGASFLNFSTEVRAPLIGSLGAVAFLDGGNVWTNPWNFEVGDLRYDVGTGLRYQTPVGPLRADLGYQLNPIEGLIVNGKKEARRFRFHFSIGHAF